MIFSIVARLVRSPAPTVPSPVLGRFLFVTIAFTPLYVVARSPTPLSLQETLKLAQTRSLQLAAQATAIKENQSTCAGMGEKRMTDIGKMEMPLLTTTFIHFIERNTL